MIGMLKIFILSHVVPNIRKCLSDAAAFVLGKKAELEEDRLQNCSPMKHRYLRRKVIWLMVCGQCVLADCRCSYLSNPCSLWTANMSDQDHQINDKQKGVLKTRTGGKPLVAVSVVYDDVELAYLGAKAVEKLGIARACYYLFQMRIQISMV
jgi:hypothetical protein